MSNAPLPPRKRSIFGAVFSSPKTTHSAPPTPTKSHAAAPTPAPSTTLTENLPPSSSRKKGSQVMNRSKIKSERMPDGVFAGLVSPTHATKEPTTPTTLDLFSTKRRADSDPLSDYCSTLEKDFGFEPEEEDDEGVVNDLKQLSARGLLDPSRASRLSFARDDGAGDSSRLSMNRRSLQLSVNNNNSGTNHPSSSPRSSTEIPTLRAATLDRLVDYVVTSSEFMEASQVSAFLLTYHAYVDGQGLLRALASRYDAAKSAKDLIAQIRTLFVLQRWIEEHYYDFEDDEFLLLSVAKFAEQRLAGSQDETASSPTHQLLSKLLTVRQLSNNKGSESPKRGDRPKSNGEDSLPGETQDALKHKLESPHLSVLEKKRLIKLTNNPPIDLPKDFSSLWTKFTGKSSSFIMAHKGVLTKLEIARQLTLIEHGMFKIITPTDLVGHSMHRFDGKSTTQPSTRVHDFIQHFNNVARFVSSTICGCTDPKDRAQVYKKWIKIGNECLILNNYNAVFEIMAGIHSVAVWRLKILRGNRTTKTKKLERTLENVVSRKSNFAVYRSLLALNQVPAKPTVPFIGAALADLSFLQDGNVDTVGLDTKGDALINFAKHRRVAKVMQTLKRFQDTPYMLTEVIEIKEFLEKEISNSPKDQELFQMSKQCEPLLIQGQIVGHSTATTVTIVEWPKVLEEPSSASVAPPPRRGSLATMFFGGGR